MATARDKLIADWQRRLHVAEDLLADAADAPRYAWLARMQARLYRFLLACYGKSDWNTTPPAPAAAPRVVFDSPDAALLHGKPARSPGQIQAVLKGLSGSQGNALQTGPLAHGPRPDSWVVVAALSSHVNLDRLGWLLTKRRIAYRRVETIDDERIEVAADQRTQAAAILLEQGERLHASTARVKAERTRTLVLRLWQFHFAILIGPMVAMLATNLILPADESSSYLRAITFLGIWAGVFVILTVWWCLQQRRSAEFSPVRQ